jgi:hypothetical protein
VLGSEIEGNTEINNVFKNNYSVVDSWTEQLNFVENKYYKMVSSPARESDNFFYEPNKYYLINKITPIISNETKVDKYAYAKFTLADLNKDNYQKGVYYTQTFDVVGEDVSEGD